MPGDGRKSGAFRGFDFGSALTNFAYVGTRTTGTEAANYIVSGPGSKETMPQGVTQISSPNNSVVVHGRAFVDSDSDLPTA